MLPDVMSLIQEVFVLVYNAGLIHPSNPCPFSLRFEFTKDIIAPKTGALAEVPATAVVVKLVIIM
jgi:hypothetical protein